MREKSRIARVVLFIGMMAVSLSLCSCTQRQRVRYIYTCFDTVCEIRAEPSESGSDFSRRADEIQSRMEYLHRLFDIYHEYEGMHNLCTVNRSAGSPVEVEEALLDFLEYCVQICTRTDARVNIAMGAVLSVWHDARTAQQPYLPDAAVLREAAQHTDIALLRIDRAAGTVMLTDPQASIDVGALAKGYAAERMAQYLYEDGACGYLLNFGGNVRMVGCKADGAGWRCGIRDPGAAAGEYVAVCTLSDTSLVTSGSYERYAEIDGVRYHHIIDPDTLYPATYAVSVSVICQDSADADALSTALFTLPLQEGERLLTRFPGAAALWVFPDATVHRSAGFPTE